VKLLPQGYPFSLLLLLLLSPYSRQLQTLSSSSN
jgi:hypothetical protein